MRLHANLGREEKEKKEREKRENKEGKTFDLVLEIVCF